MQQDVLGLDIAVDDALAMGVIERARDLRRDAHRVGDRQLLLPRDPLPQRLAVHERHDVEEQAIGVAGVMQRQDVRMLQVGGGLDLLEEPVGAHQGGEVRVQHLDRDLAIVLEVVGQIDRGHPAGTQLALDAVAAGEGAAASRADVSITASSPSPRRRFRTWCTTYRRFGGRQWRIRARRKGGLGSP